MRRMVLIASAAYVDQDLASEVGLLPPAFLPVGNRRLFSYQIEFLSDIAGDIYLSIPQYFEVDAFDEMLLAKASVSIIRVPENLPLGHSILYCWNATGTNAFYGLTVLHGDTLFSAVDFAEDDVVAVNPNKGFYQRATASALDVVVGEFRDVWAAEGEMVVSGYFALSSPHLLMKGIVETGGNFVDALRFYAKNIDVRAAHVSGWLDFGHINSFFKSRTEMTTQRAFNEMKISPRMVTKSSINKLKMESEASWFENIPPALRIHTPTLLGRPYVADRAAASYELEYLYLIPLNDLFVYGALTAGMLHHVLQATKVVITDFMRFKPSEIQDCSIYDSLYLPKTLKRLDRFASERGFDIGKPLRDSEADERGASLMQMAIDSAKFISPTSKQCVAVSHGDFCFSNILFDSRSGAVKIVDPRGMDDQGNMTIYGDIRYDLAKLHHSVVGLYDFIIAGRYELEMSGDQSLFKINFSLPGRIGDAERLFVQTFFADDCFDSTEILAITVHLFLSMLPLHYDRPDRQDAMIANAIRLFRRLPVAPDSH